MPVSLFFESERGFLRLAQAVAGMMEIDPPDSLPEAFTTIDHIASIFGSRFTGGLLNADSTRQVLALIELERGDRQRTA